jgi:glutamine synthetase
MEALQRVARRHNLVCLLHEKPFAGVNGSGKHCNWSMMDSEGRNLLEPGATPAGNLQFLVVLMAVLKGVHRRAGLLRAAIASAGNDHRLGANEAPPAIISVFLGDQLTRVLDGIEKGEAEEKGGMERIALGVSKLPEVAKDNTDRNRTSPFAFTGNKFEFRAVSSAASISTPVAYLNAAVGEAIAELVAEISARKDSGRSLEESVLEVVREAVKETKAVRFEGNNYAAEWVKEARRRGLLNLRTSPEALEQMVTPEARAFLTQSGVFSEAEIESRFHVKLERYVKDIEIEVDSLRNLVAAHVLPAAYKQLGLIAGSAKSRGAALKRLQTLVDELEKAGTALQALSDKGQSLGLEKKAHLYAEKVVPAMAAVREASDRIEESVADEFWTLPKYAEMLLLV